MLICDVCAVYSANVNYGLLHTQSWNLRKLAERAVGNGKLEMVP